MADTYDVAFKKPTEDKYTGYMLQRGPEQGMSMYLVNPYAQKIGSGDRQFQDDQTYDYFTVKDWSNGFGHKLPEEGYLYGHIDTRFPQQAILPMEPLVPSYAEMPNGGTDYVPGSVVLLPEGTEDTHVTKACATFRVLSDVTVVAHQATVKIKAPQGAKVYLSIHSLSAGRFPLTNLGTGVATVSSDRPVAEYVSAEIPQVSLSPNTEYALVVECDQEAELYNTAPAKPNDLLSTVGRRYYPTLGYWKGVPYTFQFAVNLRATSTFLALQDGEYFNLNLGDPDLDVDGDWFITNEFQQRVTEFCKAKNQVFAAWGSFLDVWDVGANAWVNVYDSGGPQIQDILSLDDKVYIALGPNGYAIYDPQLGSVDTNAQPASLLYQYRGYLWVAYDNEIWYTADEIQWEGPFSMCRDPYQVRGMAGMGELVYFACDDGLYILEFGDLFSKQVAKWPSIDARNGNRMVSWLNNLYIPLAEDVIQYSQSGVMLQMGLRVGEGLPADLQGDVFFLHPTNYFLLAIVNPELSYGAPSLWAYNSNGWHNILRLPQGAGAGAIFLDTESDTLWLGTGRAAASRTTYPPSVVNPVRDFSQITFAREGWIEFDDFDGRLAELFKDAEHIYVNSELVEEDEGQINLYWKADSDVNWNLLGTVTKNSQSIRWDNYQVRPAFKNIRLGLALRTNKRNSSPVMRAHALKFLAIANDRWGWQLRVLITDFPEEGSGDVEETYDKRKERREYIEMLANEKPPIIFRDVDLRKYESRITAARRDISRYEIDAMGNRLFDAVYSLTVEQVIPEEYTE